MQSRQPEGNCFCSGLEGLTFESLPSSDKLKGAIVHYLLITYIVRCQIGEKLIALESVISEMRWLDYFLNIWPFATFKICRTA